LQLTKLQLVGFKTFADKTEIDLGEGLTAVVGPNGCGKSNVGDALLWVMGEQNPRLLRGSESRDVIFSGTDRRKPLGMAEVRLTIDNADKALPVDFAEVTVTRRIYRSGESQYLLNNAPCRLKDIVEMFLDTGIGKGAYSFVSQSEIDAVLSARAEDRRELFEEAAGIKKYRVKKREAVRKLEQAESNLTRIRDIVHELEQQRAPLEKQAVEARRYLTLTERLQQIEVDLLIAEARKADYELYANRQEMQLDQEAVQRFDADLAGKERESDVVGERLAEAEHELDSARISQQSAMTTVERTESQLQLAQERGRGAEQTAESLDQELRDLALRAERLEKEIAALSAALSETETGEAAGRADLASARARLAELETALREAVRQGEDRQGALRRMAEQRAQREAALAGCRSRLAETESRLERLSAESAAIQDQLAAADARVFEGRARLEGLRGKLEGFTARQASLSADRRTAQDAHGRARTDLDAARRLLAERSSRLATLTELQESGEGFYQGVRAVLNAVRHRKLTGAYAPVVDLLTVPEELRIAVEVALGASAQDIVCETEAEAKAAIEWLKSTRSGRATFLALPLLNPSSPLSSAAVKGFEGMLGAGGDLVKADPRYGRVVQLLLGRVAIASDMDSAVRVSRRMQGWSRIVTVEGELLSPGGALTGGSLQGRGAHLVGRKGEIDDLNRAIPALRADVDRLSTAVEAGAAQIGKLEQELTDVNRLLSEAHAGAAGAERDLHAAEQDASRLRASAADSEAEQARLAEARQALIREEEDWHRQVEEGRQADTTADDAIAQAQEEARRLTVLRDEARTLAVSLEVETGRLAEKRSALKRELTANQEERTRILTSQEQRRNQRELASMQFADSDARQHELRTRLEEARRHLTECEKQFIAWRDRRQALLAQSFEQQSAIKEMISRRADTMKQMHDAELQIARLEVRLSQAAQRLQDEYAMSLEEALARTDVPEIDKETASEVAKLRREIRSMGAVNTGAVDEYERLTERHDFLGGQRADLEKAREYLRTTIAEIDESTRGTFMDTFHAVSEEFDRIFSRLFNGGTTKLILTNPDDLLETGIDVFAQPPGKKPQHLSLLSGGERALTATALLFSFLAVKPSPFVLLDEVDAPLDGANVERFVQLVKDFGDRTQFLIITHNPTTMEAAPRWYGVTMQEPGVSRILSYRVPQDQTIESEPEQAVVLTAG